MNFSLFETILLYAIPVILAITLHEAAHGYVARMLGDSTAYMLGRVTLNPLKHIDPVGTIAVPLGLLLLSKLAGGGGFLFGWAKPVPVNFANLRHPKNDMFWVLPPGPVPICSWRCCGRWRSKSPARSISRAFSVRWRSRA